MSSKSPVVVIVDDEDLVLQSISSFLELETDYEVLTFNSPKKALEEINNRPVDIVISDFLMPEMNGLEFLVEVRKYFPDIPLILITGYADKENAINSINKIGLFQYIEKPWENDQLQIVIRNGLQNKDLKEALMKKVKELDNVLLDRDRLVEHNNLMKNELTLARRLQVKMLPDNPLSHNGIRVCAKYKPALEIGGDFYDVISLADNRLAIVIADVTGHGIQAALSTSLLKFAFSSFSGLEVKAEEILGGMNKILHHILPIDIFVAAMVITINPLNGLGTIVNGGIPHPFLLKRKERKIEKIPVNGLILGFTDENIYKTGEQYHFALKENESLILFTDGVTEAENQDGIFFEDGQLVKYLSSILDKDGETVLDGILSQVEQFIHSKKNRDDITIIGIDKISS
jgi:serine phosphatase RsbU (regulator of sigma subunit)